MWILPGLQHQRPLAGEARLLAPELDWTHSAALGSSFTPPPEPSLTFPAQPNQRLPTHDALGTNETRAPEPCNEKSEGAPASHKTVIFSSERWRDTWTFRSEVLFLKENLRYIINILHSEIFKSAV